MYSLDVIDECVSISHKVKKNSLRVKSSPDKYVGKYPVLHTPHPHYLDDEAIAVGSVKHSIIKPGTPQSKGKRVTRLDHLPPSIASRPNTPGKQGGGVVLPAVSVATPLAPKRHKPKNSFFTVSSADLESVDSSSSTATSANDTDIEARRVLKAVENELKHWWNKYRLERVERDLRGFFAEELSETYLLGRLDKLPDAPAAGHIRTQIEHLIEAFEVDAKLPYRVSGDASHMERQTKAVNFKRQPSLEEVEKERRRVAEELADEERRAEALLERRRREKELRKRQYDLFKRSHAT